MNFIDDLASVFCLIATFFCALTAIGLFLAFLFVVFGG